MDPIEFEFYKCPAYYIGDDGIYTIISPQNGDSTNDDGAITFRIKNENSLSRAIADSGRTAIQYDDTRAFHNPRLTGQKDTGYIHVLDAFWRNCRLDTRVAWPPDTQGREYEYKELVSVPIDSAGRWGAPSRYHGFHATVAPLPRSTKMRVTIFFGGESLTDDARFAEASIERADYALHFHRWSSVKFEDPSTWTGSLYVLESTWTGLSLSIPKLPPGLQ